ncbi:recombinase family protein [Planktomarina temperata]|nr:recombinase family protein [Planktomarina temperata]MDB2460854.1 recombinase family protein [Planktomarina temperata]
MSQGSIVTYLRVSTARQGKSGLGLEAQQKAVADYLSTGQWNLLEDFVEVESGKNSKRPKLLEAIELCKASGAKLLVAKLDRLARDAAFLMNLKDAGIDFVCADMPEANRLTIGIMALVAEQEREAISKRTKEALAAAKARGVQLGAYRDGVYVGGKGNADTARNASEARTVRFHANAVDKLPLLKRYDPDGSMSLRAIADIFNRYGVKTVSGRGQWSANSVRRLKMMGSGND